MHLDSPALVLDVPDMHASRTFLETHLGYTVSASGDDFTALSHDGHDLRIIVGPLKPGVGPSSFAGMQVGFIVENIDEHWARLKDTVTIGQPIETIDLGDFKERFFQIVDPNGVTYRLIQFVD